MTYTPLSTNTFLTTSINEQNFNVTWTSPYYLETDNVYAQVNGSDWSVVSVSGTTVTLASGIPSNANVFIYRETDISDNVVNFSAGSTFRAQDINSDFDQVLFKTQENQDALNSLDDRVDIIAGSLDGIALYLDVANTAALNVIATDLLADPSITDTRYQIIDSTNVDGLADSPAPSNAPPIPAINSLPSNVAWNSGIATRVIWNGSSWNFQIYIAYDPDARYVDRSGDSMTGQLELPGGGGTKEALQKQEVEALLSAIPASDLQSVTDAGNTTTNGITADGGASFGARVDVGDSGTTSYSRINTGGDGSFVANQPAGDNSGFTIVERPSGDVKVDLKADGSITAASDINLTDSTVDLYSQTTNVDSKTFQLFSDVGGTKAEKVSITADGSITAAGGDFDLASYGAISIKRTDGNNYPLFRWGTDASYSGGGIYPDGSITAAGTFESEVPANTYALKITSGSTNFGGLYSSSAGGHLYLKDGAGGTKIALYGNDGSITAAGKITSASTVSGDSGTTLVTKDYLDGGGAPAKDLQAVTDAGNTTTNGITTGDSILCRVGENRAYLSPGLVEVLSTTKDTTNAFRVQGGRGGASQEDVVTISTAGASTFASTITAGNETTTGTNIFASGSVQGIVGGSQKWYLGTDGSITAQSYILAGPSAIGGTGTGAYLLNAGVVAATRGGSDFIWTGYQTSNSTPTSTITADGLATFAGSITAASAIRSNIAGGNYAFDIGGQGGLVKLDSGATSLFLKNGTDPAETISIEGSDGSITAAGVIVSKSNFNRVLEDDTITAGSPWVGYIAQKTSATLTASSVKGFTASNLTNGTETYGFHSDIPDGTNRYNFYAAGNAPSYFAGNIQTDGSIKVEQEAAIVAVGHDGVEIPGNNPASLTYGVSVFGSGLIAACRADTATNGYAMQLSRSGEGPIINLLKDGNGAGSIDIDSSGKAFGNLGYYQQIGTGNNFFNGNTGIGTDTPLAKLHVVGGVVNSAGSLTTNNQYRIGVNDDGNYSAYFSFGSPSYSSTKYCLGIDALSNGVASDVIIALAGGKVGVGTDNPQATFDVVGTIKSNNVTFVLEPDNPANYTTTTEEYEDTVQVPVPNNAVTADLVDGDPEQEYIDVPVTRTREIVTYTGPTLDVKEVIQSLVTRCDNRDAQIAALATRIAQLELPNTPTPTPAPTPVVPHNLIPDGWTQEQRMAAMSELLQEYQANRD